MNYFFTSDRHFFHEKILTTLCPTTRYGDDADHMNELMIEAHNRIVGPNDVCFDLGDVSYGSAGKTAKLLKRLNGRQVLIFGNHDRYKGLRVHPEVGACYDSVQSELLIKINGQDIYMHHMPHRQWERMHYGVWHLFGHVHGAFADKPWGKSMDVGIDARDPADMAPWSFDEVKAYMDAQPILKHHGD